MKKLIKESFANLIALYCRNIPINRGKWRLKMLGRRITNGLTLPALSKFNTRFIVTIPKDSGSVDLFFLGVIESSTTAVISSLLKPSDIFLDIGANIGWYTNLAATIIKDGVVHSFEPVPSIFEKLKRNTSLNDYLCTCNLNNLALGNKTGTVEIYTFAGLPDGHSSLSTHEREDFRVSETEIVPLDDYLKENNIEQVDFIKIDAEGSEMNILEGAQKLFQMSSPPLLIIEMNEDASRSFGYSPWDLIEYCKLRNYSDFYRISGREGKLFGIQSSKDYKNGDNVLFCHPSRKSILESYVGDVLSSAS